MSGAIHEAGHAVLFLATGQEFRRVTRTEVQPCGEVDQAMIHLAGVAAQVIAGGAGEQLWASAKVDGEQARKYATLALERRGVEPTPEAVERQLAEDWRRAIVILKANWHGVQRIASLLENVDELDYATTLYLFEQAMGPLGR